MTRTSFAISKCCICRIFILLVLLAQSEVLCFSRPFSALRSPTPPLRHQRLLFSTPPKIDSNPVQTIFTAIGKVMRLTDLKGLLKGYARQPGNFPKVTSVLADILKYAQQDGSHFVEPETPTDTKPYVEPVGMKAASLPSGNINNDIVKSAISTPFSTITSTTPVTISVPLTRAQQRKAFYLEPELDLNSLDLDEVDPDDISEADVVEVRRRIHERKHPTVGKFSTATATGSY